MINIRENLFETNSSSMHSFVVTNKKAKTITPEMIKELINERGKDTKEIDWDKHEELTNILGFYPYSWNEGEPPVLEYDKWNYENDLVFERTPMRILTTTAEKLAFLIASYNSWCKGRNNTETKDYLNKDILPLMRKYIPNLEIKFPHISCDNDGWMWIDDKGFIYDEYDVYDKNGKWAATTANDALEGPFHAEKTISYDSAGNTTKENIPVKLANDEEYKEIFFYGTVDHESCDLLEESLAELNITIEEYLFNNNIIIIIDGDEYEDFKKLQQCGLIPDEAIKVQLFQKG